MCILSRLVPLWAMAGWEKALACLFTTLGNKEFVLSCLVLSCLVLSCLTSNIWQRLKLKKTSSFSYEYVTKSRKTGQIWKDWTNQERQTNLDRLDKSGQTGQIWTDWTNLDRLDKSGQTGQIWTDWTNLDRLDKSGQIWTDWTNLDKSRKTGLA